MDRPTPSPFLFDRTFWAERLSLLDRSDLQLRRTPTDGSWRADRRATELGFRALDGNRLWALLLEPERPPARPGLRIVVCITCREEPGAALPTPPRGAAGSLEGAVAARSAGSAPRWTDLPPETDRAAGGRPTLVVALDPGRRLEDRVLDLIRAVDAARGSGGAALHGPTEIEGSGDLARIGRQVIELRPRR